MTPSKEAVAAAGYIYDGMTDARFTEREFVKTFAPTIDDEFAALRARLAELELLVATNIAHKINAESRLATAEGYLLGLTDDAAWANHKDCICGDCELRRDIRAFLAQPSGEEG